MTNEMIERVAKAIENHEKKYKITSYEAIARAAIQIMYEPTDQQRNYYFDLKRESGSTEAYSTFEDATWQMMIEACLLERRIG